jgi:hypothetical protein
LLHFQNNFFSEFDRILTYTYIIHIIIENNGEKMANAKNREDWGAVFVETDVREVCTNADEVVRKIKNAFPGETTESLSRHTGVSFQTVQRWLGSGRADGQAFRRLIEAFPEKKSTNERVYLDKATAKQLYERCSVVGWDKVIQTGRNGSNA